MGGANEIIEQWWGSLVRSLLTLMGGGRSRGEVVSATNSRGSKEGAGARGLTAGAGNGRAAGGRGGEWRRGGVDGRGAHELAMDSRYQWSTGLSGTLVLGGSPRVE